MLLHNGCALSALSIHQRPCKLNTGSGQWTLMQHEGKIKHSSGGPHLTPPPHSYTLNFLSSLMLQDDDDKDARVKYRWSLC